MYRILFTGLFSLFVFCSIAQTKIIIHENTTQHDKNKKKKKSSAAGTNESKVKDAPNNFLWTSESAVKLNISPIFRGDYCLSFEKKITPLLSAEVTGGVTYSDQMFDEIGTFLNYKPYNMTPYRRKRELGPSLKIAARHYFDADDESIAGPYVALEGMFRRYNATVIANYTALPVKEYNDHREIRTFIGWQGSDWTEVAFYDISLGVGYRMHVRNYVGWTDTTNYYYDSLMQGQKNYFIFLVNLKIGFLLDY